MGRYRVQGGRTFRIFVSSTFSDLKEERNALQKYVFPGLRELCMQHGCRFQAIDLRWGISEEAGLDQQTVKICLEEIARCQKTSPKPNFIILLGDRYGWQPVPSEIPDSEFDKILKRVSDDDAKFIEWRPEQDEDHKGWYRKDENAIPPVYCLRPRTGNYEKREYWNPVEARLRSILRSAIATMELDADASLKYMASATEQEIVQGALKLPKNVPDSREHIFGFFREVENLSDVKRDTRIQPARSTLSDGEKDKPLPSDFIDMAEGREFDEEAHEKLLKLKRVLKNSLPGNIHEYTAQWGNNCLSSQHIGTLPEDVLKRMERGEPIGDPDTLCVAVWNRLYGVIMAEIRAIEKIEPLELEIAAHEEFCKKRADVFIGRGDLLGKISKAIPGSRPIVIHGVSGSGKSALIAKAIDEARKNHPGSVIISRFIGTTPSSSDVRSLLESICQEIVQEYGDDGAQIPPDYNSLIKKFFELITLAKAEKQLLIFIDALDQLSATNDGQSLDWLLVPLPDNVLIVATTIPDQGLTLLKSTIPPDYFFEVEDMKDSGKELLKVWLDGAHRKLKPEQRDEVINKFNGNGLPLYMKFAFEEARRWKSYTPLTTLKPDIPGVIEDMLDRLSSKHNHGEMVVSRSLGYLAAAKNGLSEDELVDVLSLDEDVFNDFIQHARHTPPENKLPIVVWSRLFFDLEPYLTERKADGTSLLSFYHRQLREAIESKYLKGMVGRHCALAEYFSRQSLYNTENFPNLRKVSELPYQQASGRKTEELNMTLTDLAFIEAKFRGGMGYDLLADYDRIGARLKSGPPIITAWYHDAGYGAFCPFCLTTNSIDKGMLGTTIHCHGCDHKLTLNPFVIPVEWRPSHQNAKIIGVAGLKIDVSEDVPEFADYVQGNMHILLNHPELTFQQAINQPDTSTLSLAAKRKIKEGYDRPWIEWKNKPGNRSQLIMTIKGHTNQVNSCVFSPDGKKIASASYDKTVKVWDADTGRELRSMAGHTSYVNKCAFSPDGKRIASASDDRSIRVWDVDTGQQLRVMTGHANNVYGCAFSPDGRSIASASQDKSVRVWDADTGMEERSLTGHTYPVNSCVFSPDGKKIASASYDKTVKVWDADTGRELRTLTGHTSPVSYCVFSPDGRSIASASFDKTVKVWDAETGKEIKTLIGHSEWVYICVFSPDGRSIASASQDKSVRVWDVEKGNVSGILKGHTNTVNSCAFSADGRRIASGSWDYTLKVWDANHGRESGEPSSHTDSVQHCTFSPDGRKLASGSMDNTIRVRDAGTGRLLQVLTGHKNIVNSCAFSPDNKKIASASRDGSVGVWDVETGRVLGVLNGHGSPVLSCIFSPDGGKIASVSGNGWVKVWDADTGGELISLKGYTCAFSPDSKKIVSASDNYIVRIYDAETGQELKMLPDHRDSVNDCIFSPDGGKIASASDDESVIVWDVETERKLWAFKGHTHNVDSCIFSPDGQRIASASRDGSVRVWDVGTGKALMVLEGRSGASQNCTFSPDGKKIISTSSDKTVRIWDAITGKLIGVFITDGQPICLDISSIGIIAVGDNGGNVYTLTVNGFFFDHPVITPLYNILVDNGDRHSFVTACCAWCGKRFRLGPDTSDKVSSIKDQYYYDNNCPGSKATVEIDDRMVISCLKCNKKLRLSPFVVVNRGVLSNNAYSRQYAISHEQKSTDRSPGDMRAPDKPWWKLW